MRHKPFNLKWIVPLLLGVLILPGLLAIASPGLAQAAEPQDPPESAERLEELLQKQLDLLQKQEERLAKAEDTVLQIEARIQSLQEQGVDTADAEAALAAFSAALDEASESYEKAKEVLDESDGFDANGKVTDSQAALETLRTAASEQRQFHLTLSSAARDLRFALQDTIAYTRLESLFAREQEIQAKQSERLENAAEVKLRLEEYIQSEQQAGRDTAILEQALEAFEAGIAEAAEEHETAGTLIAARAGFDAQGRVTDERAARATVQDAGEAQRSFHLIAAQATVDLRQSIRAHQELWGEAQDAQI